MSIAANFYFGWMLYDLTAVLLLAGMYRRVARHQRRLVLGLFTCLFVVLAVWGNAISPDYLPYREIVDEVATTQDPFVHVERFYIWLIHQIGNNFYLYNLCVYVPLFLFFYLTFTKGTQVDNPLLFLAAYTVLGLYSAIVGRFYLFAVVYLCAVCLLARRKILAGCVLLFLSCFLHKVAYIALPLTVLFFLPWKPEKRIVAVLCVLLVCAVGVGRHLIENYLADVLETFTAVNGKDYLLREEGANEGGSLWWQVIYAYQKLVKFLLAFWVLFQLREVGSSTRLSVDRVMYFMLWWITVASLFFYGLDLPDETIAGRTLSIGIIPLCYLLSMSPHYVRVTRRHKVCFFLLCFFYMMFNNAYIVGVSHSTL